MNRIGLPSVGLSRVGLLLAFCASLGAGCAVQRELPLIGGAQTARHFSITQTRVLSADYLLYLPQGYGSDPERRWPLILFLHGKGECGTNVWKVIKHGPPKVVGNKNDLSFIVVSPQSPGGQIWSNDTLLALLDDVEKRYAVDEHRVYLTGISMGGFGTWNLGLTYPERFAAIAPFAGGGDFITPYMAEGKRAGALKSLPIWAFHGGQDPVVPLEETRHMVAIMKSLGDPEVKLTIVPGAKHDCWTEIYARPDLYQWFLRHSR